MGIEEIGRRILLGMAEVSAAARPMEIKAPSSPFSVTLQEADGRGQMSWDKQTITREELKIYFPGTLGGILEADTRKPVHFNADGEMKLQSGKTYEVRTPSRKQTTPPQGSPPHTTESDAEEDPSGSMDDSDEVSSQQRLLAYLRSPDAQNNNNYTWSNLIEKALRTMGGQRTGQEITQFIEHNFRELISGKTKTWRNSVMGCLSSNARKRWVKEQTTVDGKRRYVWNLKEDHKSRSSSHHGSPRKNKQQQRKLDAAYFEDDNDNTASLLGNLAAQANSPFAAQTLSKLMRGSPPPSKKTKLFHEADTDNNMQTENNNATSSPVRAPAGSPARSNATAQRSSMENSQIPSPSKAPLFLLSNVASLPDSQQLALCTSPMV